MRVEERGNGTFDVWVTSRYDPDAEGMDLAELVELKAAVDRALFDFLCRNVGRLITASSGDEANG